jgi:hypothetical protein
MNPREHVFTAREGQEAAHINDETMRPARSRWAEMTRDRRADVLRDVMRSGAIPLYTEVGANSLHLLGADADDVRRLILHLYVYGCEVTRAWVSRKLEHAVEDRRTVVERGLRAWLESKGNHI